MCCVHTAISPIACKFVILYVCDVHCFWIVIYEFIYERSDVRYDIQALKGIARSNIA